MRILIVENNEGDNLQIKDACSQAAEQAGLGIETRTCDSAKSALTEIGSALPDLLIVDLRLAENIDDRSGWEAVSNILGREIVPVIVYSAYSDDVAEDRFQNVLIVRIQKGHDLEGRLLRTIAKFLEIRSVLNSEKSRVIGQFGQLTLETAGKILSEHDISEVEAGTLASMALSRLTSYLLANPTTGRPPPEAMFLFPPIEAADPYDKASLFLGDILGEEVNGEVLSLWIVMSPSCDLAYRQGEKPRLENVMLLKFARAWREASLLAGKENPQDRRNSIRDRLRDGTIKMLKCPEQIFGAPILLVDMKEYQTRTYQELTTTAAAPENRLWRKIATMATPYAESLQNHFLRDFSRIGTPDTATRDQETEWAEMFVTG